MIKKTLAARSACVAVLALLALALVPAALAAKGGGGGSTTGGGKHGGGGSTTCTQNAPAVAVQNNWSWGATGSWGLPGQRVGYQVQVISYDVGCGSSTFTLGVSAPSGFSVSIPTSSVSVGSGSSVYLWFYVTSPIGAGDGDYPLTITAQRTNGPSASATTVYKLYSSDTAAPTLFWSNPSAGQSISGNSYTVNVSSEDDHSVRRIDFYLDGAFVTSTTCDGATYICQLTYKMALHGLGGQHSASFESTDWMGNVGTLTVSFTVS